MKKSIKAILSISLISIVGMLIFASTVLASSTSYTSSLYMEANSSHSGSSRTYNERNHSISLYELTSTNADLEIELIKKNLFSSSTVYTGTVNIRNANTTYSKYMGNHDTGKYYYLFSTFGKSNCGKINANPVTMTSYN